MPARPNPILITLLLLTFTMVMPSLHAIPPTKTKAPSKHPKSLAPTVDLVEWKPNPKLLATLGPPKQFGAYVMRLPPGYTITATDKTTPARPATGYQITGPARRDSTFPGLFVFLGTAPAGINTPPAGVVLDDNGVLSAKPSLTKSEQQTGHTAYLQFFRQYYKWRFVSPTARWVHGFQYAASDGATYVLVMAFDSEPHHRDTLPLLEAAVLTLRKTH